MKCSRCEGKMESRKATRQRPFQYVRSGLDNVYLVGVTVSQCRSCHEEWVEIPAMEQLLSLIADTLSRKSSALEGQEIRYLRKFGGFSSKKMAETLGMAPETFSRVENDHYRLNPAQERLLRLMGRADLTADSFSEALVAVSEAARAEAKKVNVIRLQPVGKNWKLAA